MYRRHKMSSLLWLWTVDFEEKAFILKSTFCFNTKLGPLRLHINTFKIKLSIIFKNWQLQRTLGDAVLNGRSFSENYNSTDVCTSLIIGQFLWRHRLRANQKTALEIWKTFLKIEKLQNCDDEGIYSLFLDTSEKRRALDFCEEHVLDCCINI